jgi:hypothetical protein
VWISAATVRFMEASLPAFEAQRALRRQEVLVITLEARLSPNISHQAALLTATRSMLDDRTNSALTAEGFELERQDFKAVLAGTSFSDAETLYEACRAAFGPNVHVAARIVVASW